MIIQKNNNNIPEYLDADFFKNVLASHLKTTNFELESVDFSMGSSGGENYLSYIYRVHITYNERDSTAAIKDCTYIVKSIPLDGFRQMFAELNIFNKEKEMYTNIVPQIEECLGVDVQVQPKCYYTTDKPIATMVFEDMKQSNCDLADRCLGLDEEHARIVLQKLAQYHAGSMLLMEKNPSVEDDKMLATGLFGSAMWSRESMVSNMEQNLHLLADHASKWSDYEKIVEYLRDTGTTAKYVEEIQETIRIKSDDIVVINHGDMWVNNFLFKYNGTSKMPEDVVLIDFQGSFRGSLGLDINYLIYSSFPVELLPKTEELIKTAYYPAFKQALENGGYKHIPSFEIVLREVNKKRTFGFMSALVVLPTVSLSKEHSAENSVEKFQDLEFRKRLKQISCSSPRFLGACKYYFNKYGI